MERVITKTFSPDERFIEGKNTDLLFRELDSSNVASFVFVYSNHGLIAAKNQFVQYEPFTVIKNP